MELRELTDLEDLASAVRYAHHGWGFIRAALTKAERNHSPDRVSEAIAKGVHDARHDEQVCHCGPCVLHAPDDQGDS